MELKLQRMMKCMESGLYRYNAPVTVISIVHGVSRKLTCNKIQYFFLMISIIQYRNRIIKKYIIIILSCIIEYDNIYFCHVIQNDHNVVILCHTDYISTMSMTVYACIIILCQV